jgi:SOS-response transcriptional repressor LexA
MSWRASAWALNQRTGLASANHILLALASYANADGVAWPSQQVLADATEQSVDSVQRHLRLLEERGLISIQRRPGRRGQWPSLEYRLPFNRPRLAAHTEPHSAVRRRAAPCGTDHAANTSVTGPQIAPSPSRKLCGTNLQENLQDEPSEPHGVRPEPTESKVLEEEPSGNAVPNLGRRRPEEGQQATEERKKREESYEELQRRHPGLLPRLKRM